jgi:nucleoside-diphosphate-sugar epimerase
MKILITGGTGMVGKNLLNHKKILKNTILAPNRKQLDLCNFSNVITYIKNNLPDLIIHCAGHVGGIQANINNPVSFLIDNLDMGRNVVMAARQCGVPKLINLGSSCMYPKDISRSISEEQLLTGRLEPTNEGYSLAKIVTAKLCSYINQIDNNFSYKTIVPCNLYGEHDKFDLENAHLIPAIITKIFHATINNEPEVEIWGDGKARREFMYVKDLTDFIAYSIQRFDEMPDFLNVGTGKDYSVNEYYLEVSQIIGFQGNFLHDTSRAVGMNRKLTDITKLSEFGWKAQTNLKTGIMNTYDFFKREIVGE